ncbi:MULTISPECIES: response regulator transcription factor [Pseudomonas]|uniref:Transcriptional regulator n=2 Tax=Pseudomonadaceae TaxID=135621 RepID=A0A0D0L1C7_9PSED|nr:MULTISPECIES: response regulator transcription factor [Pseudomonas]KIQ06307.1 transcriptional regulator [Pseudomonas fulva]MCW2291493.1 two-component system response regulator PfeR [Pseudomonas sp. BIGb0408]NYH73936.1 two-component system response regulator PfeR [Pseudomonas flavescens]
MMSSATHAIRILAVEDDPALASHLQAHLQGCGFEVTVSRDGSEGLRLAQEQDFDLILMDILLPGSNGLDVLQRLRERRHVPVILMSALGAEQDRIAGFSKGADDYLPKPFSLGELSVRIEAILRRVAYERREQPPPLQEGALKYDEDRSDVCHDGHWALLTPTEYRLLETFSRHAEEVLSKAFLYQHVLHRGYAQHDRSLDMHVSNVRRKLKQIGYTGMRLESVWGKGYVLTGRES